MEICWPEISLPSGQWNFRSVPLLIRSASDIASPVRTLKVHSVLTGPGRSLFLGCGEGICRLTGSQLRCWGPKEGVEEDDWQSLYLSSNGDLWAVGAKHIATLPKGASTFQNRSIPEMQNPDSLIAITEDPQGRVLTSSGKQLLRWENGAWKTFDERQGLPPYGIAPVFVNPGGEVWFASNGHGLSRWLGYNLWETWTSAEGLQSDTIWGILRDRNGRLWVGNDNGLAFLDPGQKRFTPWPLPGLPEGQRVSGLAQSYDGAVWLGAGSTVFRIDAVTRKLAAVQCPGSILMVFADSRNRLWVGTKSGIDVINTSPERHQSYRCEASPGADQWTSHLTETPDGQIFAYARTGLFRLEGAAWHEDRSRPGLELGGNDSPLGLRRAEFPVGQSGARRGPS